MAKKVSAKAKPAKEVKKEPYSVWFGPTILIVGLFYFFVELGYLPTVPNTSIWPVLFVIFGIKLMRRYER